MKYKYSKIPITVPISLRNRKILNLVKEKGPLTLIEIVNEIFWINLGLVGLEVNYLCKLGYLEEIE